MKEEPEVRFFHSDLANDSFARGRVMTRCRPDASRCSVGLTSVRILSTAIALGVIVSTVACTREGEPEPPRGPASAVLPASAGPRATVALDAEDGQWTMPIKSYSAARYSQLGEITTDNVKNLRSAWTFSTSVLRGHEEPPIVVNNTMYVLTPFPNILYALDLTQPGAPKKWQYEPKPQSEAQGVACCDVVNRGPSFADGKIVFNTLDNHVVAVDAATGKELWKTKVGDINIGETMTMAPLVVKGKVLVGNSGGEMGVRGWLKALDLGSGRLLWTAYSTGPDVDVKIGSRFKAFYPKDQGKDLGVNTWQGEQWKIGGGNVWGWLSYDPQTNLVYHGTSNPGPWTQEQRRGDNKWTASILARDADTGELRWAFQPTPHDLWDYDAVNENILVDLPMQGRTRAVLVHFDRNGFAYTMDRTTGEVLVAAPFVPMNWSTGVDLATGRPRMVPEKMTALGKKVTNICPSLEGGKNQQPAAFSPRTGLFYVPTNNLCMDFEARPVTYIAGTPYIGALAPETRGP